MPFPVPSPLRWLVLALSLGAVAGPTSAKDLPAAEDAFETSSVDAPSEEMPPSSGPASSASAPASGEPVAPDEWKAWNGQYFRLDDTGDVQCYSEDGERCSLNRPNPALARPVRCERQVHPLRHILADAKDISGYEEPDHWCNNAYANLFATWTNYQPLGYPVVLSTNAHGDVMCKSFDATTCLAPGEHGPLAPKQLKPVVCGRSMAQWTGVSGYDDPDHWCSSPELVRRIKAPQGDAMHVSSSGKLLSKTYQVTLPGWDAREQPTWIVRFTMPHPDRSGIRLDAQGKLMSWTPEQHANHWPNHSGPQDGYERHASIAMTGEQRAMLIDDFATSAASRVPVLSRKGRGQLALRIDDPGRVRFFQGDGWHRKGLTRLDLDGDGRLLPLWKRVRWPESKTMTFTITTSLWPADGRQRLDMSDLRRAPLPALHDILLTRKRPPRRPD